VVTGWRYNKIKIMTGKLRIERMESFSAKRQRTNDDDDDDDGPILCRLSAVDSVHSRLSRLSTQ
jgi:hypothetical protein